MIIFFHCKFYKEYNQTISYLLVNGLFRIAVPIFFIINGFFLDLVIKKNLIFKWFKRVILLYFIWMLLYSPIWFTLSLKNNLKNIIIGYHHLWYIKAMLLSGLFLSIITKKNNSIKKLTIISLLFFLIGILIQYNGNYYFFNDHLILKISNNLYAHRNFLFLGIPFVCIGYIIKKKKYHIIKSKRKFLIITLICIMCLFLESYFNYLYSNKAFDNLFSLLLICPLLFILFYNINVKSNFNGKNISLLSTGIYLTHPLVISFFKHFFLLKPTTLSIITLLTSSLIAYALILIKKHFKFIL